MSTDNDPPPPALRPDLPTEPPAGWADDPVDVAIDSLSGPPILTPVIIAINLAIFVAMLATGVHVMSPDVVDLVRWGANTGPRTLDGEWWRLGSSMFIHIGIVHILMNMAVLWEVGGLLERLVGRTGYVAAYVVSGLAGSLASVGWNPNVVSAGASGAVFGVLGCLIGLLLRDRRSVPVAARGRLAKMAGVFLAYNLLFGAAVEGIDMAAHIGGLLAGVLCGVVLALPLEPSSRAKRPMRAVAVVLLGLVGLGAGSQSLGEPPMEVYATQKVHRGASEVYYSGGATVDDANALATYLEAIQYIQPGRQTAAVVTRKADAYVIGLVVKPGAETNAQVTAAFEELAGLISANAFHGAPVEVRMLDDHVRTLRRFGPHTGDPEAVAAGPAHKELFVVGVEVGALRKSALWARYSSVAAALFDLGDLTECEQVALSSFERVLVQLRQEADSQLFVVVIDGLARDATEACLQTGEPGMPLSRDGAHTLVGAEDSGVALRWASDRRVIVAARQSPATDGPVPVLDWQLLDDVDGANPFGLEGTGPLAIAFERVHEDAAMWLAAGSPAAYVSLRLTDQVQLEARLYADSPEAAQNFLTGIAALAGPIGELPSVQKLVSALDVSTEGSTITVTGTWNEAQFIELAEAVSADEQLGALLE